MPQFAVIARSYRPSTTSDRSVDLEMDQPPKLRPRYRKTIEYIFETPKAYLVEADTAQSAMARVENLAVQRGTRMMVHRALEVAETLPAKMAKIARAGSHGRA
jgi:hypothetical protein